MNRAKNYTFRLTEAEKLFFAEKARKNGITITNLLKLGATVVDEDTIKKYVEHINGPNKFRGLHEPV